MLPMILRRLLVMPVILLVIYTTTLTLAWAIPGNPLHAGDGRRPEPEVAQAMLEQYNLDNYWTFYWSYLDSVTGTKHARTVLDGSRARRIAAARAEGQAPPERYVFDMGPSLHYSDRRVNEVVAASLPVSITLGAAAMLLALVTGVAAGVVGAIRPNSVADVSTLMVALVGISLPSFVTGTVLLVIFSVWLQVLPVARWGTLTDLALPAITLSLPFAAYIARLTRMGMLEQLGSDYIRTARAKGVGEWSVRLRHALKNAFLPVLSYLGPAAAYAMTGSFVVERVFNVPGIGQHFVSAVQNKDLFLIMGVVLVYATMLILFNLAVDVMYRWVDPRIEQ